MRKTFIKRLTHTMEDLHGKAEGAKEKNTFILWYLL